MVRATGASVPGSGYPGACIYPASPWRRPSVSFALSSACPCCGVTSDAHGCGSPTPVCGPRHRSHPPPPGGWGGATSRPPPRGQLGTTGAVSLLGTGLLLLAGFRRLVPNAPTARPRLLRSTLRTPASCRPRRYPGSPFMATPRTQPPRSARRARRNVAWGEGAIEGWVPLDRQRRLGLGQARLRSEVPPCTHWAAGAVRASRDLGLPGCRTRRRRRSQPFLAQTGPGARHCVMWVISSSSASGRAPLGPSRRARTAPRR